MALFFARFFDFWKGKSTFLPPVIFWGCGAFSTRVEKGAEFIRRQRKEDKEKKRSDFICIRRVRMKLRQRAFHTAKIGQKRGQIVASCVLWEKFFRNRDASRLIFPNNNGNKLFLRLEACLFVCGRKNMPKEKRLMRGKYREFQECVSWQGM